MNGPRIILPATALALAAGMGVQLQVLPLAHAAPAAAAHKSVITTSKNGKYTFSPTKTTIKVGTKVTWTNKSDAPHTVTGTGTWKFKSKVFNPNGTVSYTFSKAGTYHYFCSIHPFMKATVVVTK